MGTICEEKKCIYRNNKSHNHCGTCAGLYGKPLKAQTAPVAEVPCSVGLCCRVRELGETMRTGDIVLINDNFRPLGFHTDFYHYFAGLVVVEGMTGKIICKAI
jgi:hypothetical protein